MAGYSGTPLAKKLGLKPSLSVLIYGMPDSVEAELQQDLAHVSLVKSRVKKELDFIHGFVHSTADLKKNIGVWKKALSKTGALWISWPKKTSSLKSDLTGDIVRRMGLEAGLVDIKVCAVDHDWSGLKFVYRKSDR